MLQQSPNAYTGHMDHSPLVKARPLCQTEFNIMTLKNGMTSTLYKYY